MTISGITASVVNGVQEVATAQVVTSGAITSESVLILTSGAIRASGTANIVIDRTNIFVNNAGSFTADPYSSAISFNADGPERWVTNRAIRFRRSSIIYRTTERRNVFITELTDSNVFEVNNTLQLFVYTPPTAILENTKFVGINTWEVVGTPARAAGLTFENVGAAFFNYQAGRLDFVRINVTSFVNASCYIGLGSASNSVWNWDPVSFDRTKVSRALATNLYYEGVTASWEFRNRDTLAVLPNVLVIYRDNRSGSVAERGRYVTNANGRMAGTHDSRLGTNSTNTERPTLFLLRYQIADNATTGAYSAPSYDGSAGRRYDLVTVQPRIEIRSYLHEAQSSFGPSSTYSGTASAGVINGDYTVAQYSTFLLPADAAVTQTNMATVMGYSSINTLDQFYDRVKAEWRTFDNYPYATASGSVINLGAIDLVVSATAANAYAFSSSTITIKSSALTAGSKFSSILTTGTISLQNGAAVSATLTGTIIFDGAGAWSPTLDKATVRFTAAGEYDLRGATITGTLTLTNTSGGAVTVRLVPGLTIVNSGPNITVDQSVAGTGSITNIVSGSRIQIYNVTTATELVNAIVSGTSYTYSYTVGTQISSGNTIRVRLTYQSGVTAKARFESLAVAGATGFSVLAQQTNDEVYNLIGIDGSTATEFSADYPNVEVNVSDPDNSTSVSRMYAWWVSNEFTADGIRQFFGGIDADDAANFKIVTSRASIKIDNTSSTGVTFTGDIRLYRDDGATPLVASTTGGGSITLYAGKVYTVETGVSGLTPAESAKLMSIPDATSNANAVWAKVLP
jgi:hypothetical protein